MTASPPRAPMVAAFTILAAVTGELALIEIAVHCRITVVIGVTLAMAAVLGLALAVAALVAVGAGVHGLQELRARREVDRKFELITAQLRPMTDTERDRIARAVGLLDDDSGWPW